jgi:hypothetical protein
MPLALLGCAQHARPLEDPWRASLGAFYTDAPRSDAQGALRTDVALDRWVDDRFLVGVDAAYASFDRARGRNTSVMGAGIRAAYVLDLAEIQPRFGARASVERWLPSETGSGLRALFLTAFGALDWAPRAWPITLGVEVHTTPLATSSAATTAAGIPGATYGVRTAYVF